MDLEDSDHHDYSKHKACWVLKLKEKRKLTQKTLDEILQDVSELCLDIVTSLEIEVSKVSV